MEREFSAGGALVQRRQHQWWVAVIEPQSEPKLAGGKKPKRAVRALPKGLVDRGEKPDQTAIREVREETGGEGTLITKLKDIKYVYVRSWGDGQRVFKIVSFYLLLYRGGRLGDITPEMRREVKAVQWLPLEQAPRELSYKGEREVAQAALEYLSAHPELAEVHAADASC